MCIGMYAGVRCALFSILEGSKNMPIDYEWDKKNSLIRTRLWGEVTDEDINAHTLKLFRDTRLTPPLLEIIDTHDVDKLNITSQSLKNIADGARVNLEKFAGHRTAIVAATDVIFGMARMYEILSDVAGSPVKIAAFRNIEDAIAWLNHNKK